MTETLTSGLPTLVQVFIILIMGGGIYKLMKFRPEATSAAVLAGEAALNSMHRELDRLSQRVALLEAQLAEQSEARVKAEREASALRVLFETEENAHRATSILLDHANSRIVALESARP